MSHLSPRAVERKPFLEAAKRQAGRNLIVRCQWLLRRSWLTPVQILNVMTFEDRMRERWGDPDPEWIEARVADYEIYRASLFPPPADETDLPEIRG